MNDFVNLSDDFMYDFYYDIENFGTDIQSRLRPIWKAYRNKYFSKFGYYGFGTPGYDDYGVANTGSHINYMKKILYEYLENVCGPYDW